MKSDAKAVRLALLKCSVIGVGRFNCAGMKTDYGQESHEKGVNHSRTRFRCVDGSLKDNETNAQFKKVAIMHNAQSSVL